MLVWCGYMRVKRCLLHALVKLHGMAFFIVRLLAPSFVHLRTERPDPLPHVDGVKFWLVTTALLIAVSAVTLHSPFVASNNAASVFVALAAAFDWHVRASLKSVCDPVPKLTMFVDAFF